MALTITYGDRRFHIGDVVRVQQKVHEITSKGARTRIQAFEGMVIATRGQGENKSFTVRRIGAGGVGIERIFPVASPLIQGVDVLTRGAVRRAKLYYLRTKSAREVAEITRRKTPKN